MKTFIRTTFLSFGLMVFYIIPAFAAESLGSDLKRSFSESIKPSLLTNVPLPVIIGNIIQVFLGLVGSIILIVVIVAGFKYMNAEDKNSVNDSLRTVRNGVVGLIIITAAYSITAFVISQLRTNLGL